MTFFTPAQEAVFKALEDAKIRYGVSFARDRGKTKGFIISVCSSKQWRKELLNIFHTVDKTTAFDNTITGRVEIADISVCCYDWDVCTIVGEIEVVEEVATQWEKRSKIKKVTDCDIRNGKYKESEIKILGEER